MSHPLRERTRSSYGEEHDRKFFEGAMRAEPSFGYEADFLEAPVL